MLLPVRMYPGYGLLIPPVIPMDKALCRLY